MDHQKHQMRILRGCLLIWIAVSMVFAQDPSSNTTVTIEETTTQTAAENKADMSTVSGTEDHTTLNTQATGEQPAATADSLLVSAVDPSTVSAVDPSTVSATDASLQNNCHVFQCMGDNCYKNQSALTESADTACPSYCEMFRHNASYYEARCNDHCMHHMCNSIEQENCSVHCCNSTTNCFNVEDQVTASTAMPATTTTMATTTTTTIAYSDKKCRSFSCSGADCFKTQTTTATKQCRVGINHCELQKKVTNGAVSYEGGCSNTCATSTKSCASITNGDCFQECCNATNTGCCMKLDGQVHFNTAPHINKGAAFKMFICAFIVLFLSRYFSSM